MKIRFHFSSIPSLIQTLEKNQLPALLVFYDETTFLIIDNEKLPKSYKSGNCYTNINIVPGEDEPVYFYSSIGGLEEL